MEKWWFVIFVPIYLLITFFRLGPVLRADGSTSEKKPSDQLKTVLRFKVARVELVLMNH